MDTSQIVNAYGREYSDPKTRQYWQVRIDDGFAGASDLVEFCRQAFGLGAQMEREYINEENSLDKMRAAIQGKLKDCRENGDCSDAALRKGEYCSDECAALATALESRPNP